MLHDRTSACRKVREFVAAKMEERNLSPSEVAVLARTKSVNVLEKHVNWLLNCQTYFVPLSMVDRIARVLDLSKYQIQTIIDCHEYIRKDRESKKKFNNQHRARHVAVSASVR